MSEWVIVAVVGVILLFSAKKLPDMARGLGQSMRIFKAETRGMREDDAQHGDRPAAPTAAQGSAAADRTEPPAVAPGRAAADPAPGGTAGSGTAGSPTTAEPRGGSTPA